MFVFKVIIIVVPALNLIVLSSVVILIVIRKAAKISYHTVYYAKPSPKLKFQLMALFIEYTQNPIYYNSCRSQQTE